MKNYLKDFNNFDAKQLQEICLWDEYILYSVILDEGKNIKIEALDLYKQISEDIINGNIKIINN